MSNTSSAPAILQNLKPPSHLHRQRGTKIVATLGPASSSYDQIKALVLAGADVFRLNFSHGNAEDHQARVGVIRELEKELQHPLCILGDLQGPKIRLGTFAAGSVMLEAGQKFKLDRTDVPGDATRAPLPHPEIFQAAQLGTMLLCDDGKVALEVTSQSADVLETVVRVGGKLSDRKGVNIPDVFLPISALTEKDRRDLDLALHLGVDWLALSFVQRPEDVQEAKKLTAGRVAVMAKIEKPLAVQSLQRILDVADGVMVARGDLGVEMPLEDVPSIQKHILRLARSMGKPAIVATQMLESMISAPTPTRAETSDVANAIYDGADAVMLSAETASGKYPIQAVATMDRIARRIQTDPEYRRLMALVHPDLQSTAADAITAAARMVVETIEAAAIVTYTTSGSTTLRAARERPPVPILGLTSKRETARRLALSYGVHPVHTEDVHDFAEMVDKAIVITHQHGLAQIGDRIVITAGVPFGTPGNTNILRLAWVEERLL